MKIFTIWFNLKKLYLQKLLGKSNFHFESIDSSINKNLTFTDTSHNLPKMSVMNSRKEDLLIILWGKLNRIWHLLIIIYVKTPEMLNLVNGLSLQGHIVSLDFKNHYSVSDYDLYYYVSGEKVPDHDKKPTVPKVTDHIATPMRTRRSFVHKNALDAMILEPTAQDDPQYVDSPQGTKQSLGKSGMVPIFTEKKDFGKVPTYIKKLKKTRKEEELRWENEQAEIVKKREMMKLQDEEREQILQVLHSIDYTKNLSSVAPLSSHF